MMPTSFRADPVRNFVLQGIAQGSLKTEQKLPTERELANRFRRPRSAVRKALMILEAEGRILRHVGRGTFVAEVTEATAAELANLEPDASPSELLEARLVFEPSLVAPVASNATGADFRRMEECLSAAASAQSLEAYEQQDDAFHVAIARGTHNSLLIRTAELLSAARRNAAWGLLKQRSGTFNAQRRAEVRAEHLGILEALKQRDEDLARERLYDHISRVRSNLFRL